MSANARKIAAQEASTQKIAWLAKVADLFAVVVDLVRRGSRSARMVEVLLTALRLFKENRLGAVVSLEPGSTDDLPSNFQELLSIRIRDVPFQVRGALRFFDDHGIYYVGEAYMIHLRRRNGQRWVELQEFQTSVGLPLELDPIAAGWIPPYWGNPIVLRLLNSPVFAHAEPNQHDVCENEHESGRHYLGQYIAEWRLWVRRIGLKALLNRQDFLRGIAPIAGLHAAMLIPTGWVPPEGEPEGWKQFFAEHRKAADAERQRMQGVRTEIALEQGRRMLDEEDDAGGIGHLELLSARTFHALKNANLRRVIEIVRRSESDLLQTQVSGVRVFGRRTVLELKEFLQKHGLWLGMTDDDIRRVREAGQQ